MLKINVSTVKEAKKIIDKYTDIKEYCIYASLQTYILYGKRDDMPVIGEFIIPYGFKGVFLEKEYRKLKSKGRA